MRAYQLHAPVRGVLALFAHHLLVHLEQPLNTLTMSLHPGQQREWAYKRSPARNFGLP